MADDVGVRTTSGYRGKTRCGCCPFLPKKKQDKPFNQTLVIVRHSERLDHVDTSYKETDEGRLWPFDTPLTENGIRLARSVGAELAEVHKQAQFTMIASSPYRRCLQTTAEIAKVLNIPVVIDQEIGEVWSEDMPSEFPPHRSPMELLEMTKTLGIQIRNPKLPQGGIKLFGKPPKWPETIKDGHHRCIVRTNTYVQQSAQNLQNFIICSHAPAVAAMCDIFQRGVCDVSKLEYCARVIACRQLKPNVEFEESVYVDQWDVQSKGISMELNVDASEEKHLETCEETVAMAKKRYDIRTKTDFRFDKTLKGILRHDPASDEEDEDGAKVAKVVWDGVTRQYA